MSSSSKKRDLQKLLNDGKTLALDESKVRVGVGKQRPQATLHVGGDVIIEGTTTFSTGPLKGIDDQSSSNDDQLTIKDSEVVINEDSDDLDFRVESNSKTHMLYVDAGSDILHVGENLGKAAKLNNVQDFTGADPHGFSADGDMGGEIIKIGSTSTTLSKLYFLTDSGGWTLADANAASTGGPSLLALALGTHSGNHGMLLRGFARIASSILASTATAKQGDPIYISGTAGSLTFTAPSSSGDIVRIVGYLIIPANSTTDSIMYFCPDNTWVEIA